MTKRTDGDFPELYNGALRAIAQHYWPAYQKFAEEMGFERHDIYLVQTAVTFDPEPVNDSLIRVRFPYAAAGAYESELAGTAGRGFLAVTGDGDYRLTEAGQLLARRLLEIGEGLAQKLEPLSPAELERLAALLQRLILACEQAPDPPGKWCLLHSRRLDPGAEAAVIERIRRYLGDMNAYRDDAHLAAWQELDISGREWETLTYVWRGEGRTVAELAEKLAYRGHGEADYRAALAELIERGWIKKEGDEYRLNDAGYAVRQAVEEKTDDYFYAAWDVLDDKEIAELQRLLLDFRRNLEAAAEPAVAES
jgi:DNA-binding MarR family transcriptional regulator